VRIGYFEEEKEKDWGEEKNAYWVMCSLAFLKENSVPTI